MLAQNALIPNPPAVLASADLSILTKKGIRTGLETLCA